MTLASGTKLGPYDIDSLLGAGGMGEVYRARDARLNRTVAIKVLPKTFSADSERLQRFVQEARAAAALNHPNILSIFDIGEEQRSPYIVSELLEGRTLREELRGGPLTLRKATECALQVARGLAAAHEKGIVHRDLKPENIFLTEDGRVKILDFGLAKLTRPELAGSDEDAPTAQVNTEPGQVMGTVGYMSPEQVRGRATDHRSDIFSFGCILYEMLSGKRAFHGETPADTMSVILKEEPPELSEMARNVPMPLERIVRHCLEKNPAQRFQSAGDVAFNLEALSDSWAASRTSPPAVVAAGTGEETSEKTRPSKALTGLRIGLPIAVVLAAALAGVGWWVGRSSVHAPLLEYRPITFRAGWIGNARFAPDGSVVYDASWDGGDDQLYMSRTDDPGARELGLKNATLLAVSKKGELAIRLKTVFFPGYARAGTLARVPLSGGTPREVLDNVQDADWGPDGESMAVVRYVPEKGRWRLEYPIGKTLLESIYWLSHPKISLDGKLVAFADHENGAGDDEGSVAVIGADGQEKKLSSGWISVEGIAWSPGGDEVWFTAAAKGNETNPRAATLSGKVRTITSAPGTMWLQDLREGAALMITHHERVGIRGMPPDGKEERELGWFGWSIVGDLSRDGKKVLFEETGDGGGPNYTVFLRDTDGSPPVRIGEGIGKAISPDGKWVITQGREQDSLNLVPTGAGEARELTHDNVAYGNVRFLPDGRHLLASGVEKGHGVRDYLVDVSDGTSRPLTPEGVLGTWLSPDGRSTVVVGPDGKWGIWPLDGNAVRAIPGLGPDYAVTGWSPDGESVYVVSARKREQTVKVDRVNVTTGKVEAWKIFGSGLASVTEVGGPQMSADGRGYVYFCRQVLSEAYVVKGLK